MLRRRPAGNDEGAIVVLYAIVFAFVLAPLLAIGTTTLVRSSTSGELQRAADAGALAGASEIPFGDVAFARAFIDATSNGSTDRALTDLGLSYTGEDPLRVACQDVALPDATGKSTTGHIFATAPTCHASYLSDLDTLVELRNCASATLSPLAPVDIPEMSGLLPAL
ncbi:MAG: hypothetical protein JO222_05475, partial [Frankiales bacterium]|nr:hypothetical protein [Frankiales bacterium]